MLAACQTTSPPSIADVLARGGTVYQEEGCANCHGPEGTGEIGPDLSGVLDTFGSCDDQVEWVSLGSARWRQQRDSSYGDTNKPVRGGMPGFGERLEEDQIRRVVSFTRSEFAGGDEIDIVNDCFG
jgi:mono/diheme cytochrome c family protein